VMVGEMDNQWTHVVVDVNARRACCIPVTPLAARFKIEAGLSEARAATGDATAS